MRFLNCIKYFYSIDKGVSILCTHSRMRIPSVIIRTPYIPIAYIYIYIYIYKVYYISLMNQSNKLK